jgi:hypothetical protein
MDDPAAYHAEGVLYLTPNARFDKLLHLPEGSNAGKAINEAMRDIEKHNSRLSSCDSPLYTEVERRKCTGSLFCRSETSTKGSGRGCPFQRASSDLRFLIDPSKLACFPFSERAPMLVYVRPSYEHIHDVIPPVLSVGMGAD